MPKDPKDTKAKSGEGFMSIEPMSPVAGAIGGPGQPILRDGAIPPATTLATRGISPLTLPGPGSSRVSTLPLRPGEYARSPGFTGITRI